jgi:hypothetical protein
MRSNRSENDIALKYSFCTIHLFCCVNHAQYNLHTDFKLPSHYISSKRYLNISLNVSESCTVAYPTATLETIDGYIGSYLRHAPARVAGKKLKVLWTFYSISFMQPPFHSMCLLFERKKILQLKTRWKTKSDMGLMIWSDWWLKP